MKTLKKFAFLSLTALAVTSCSGNAEVKYERKDEAEVYASILGDYDGKFAQAISVLHFCEVIQNDHRQNHAH